MPTILVCNKRDSKNSNNLATEGAILADFWGIPFINVSAKEDTYEIINNIIEYLMEEIYEAEFP